MNNDLSLSLLEGIHEDDHEKITLLKNNSFNNLNKINNNSESINSESINTESINLLLFHNDSNTNFNELCNNLLNNKNLLYIGCTSIIIGSLIKYF